MKNILKTLKMLWKNFLTVFNTPMTENEYNEMMAKSGFKKCPHCGKYT